MANIFTESFETEGNGSRYNTSVPEFSDGAGDFFTRSDGSNIGAFYEVSGQDGAFFFAAMDLNGSPGTNPSESLLISDIDIAGFENLSLDILIAEDDDGSNEDWDDDSQLLIEVRVDGGAFVSLLDFRAEGGTNTEPRLDTDGDGLGDGAALSPTFASFGAPIAGTGSVLDIRISFNNLEAGDEDAAIDNIVVSGDAIASPAAFVLQITEIWPGNDQNPNLTADWFEVTNVGDLAWIASADGDLYFDDVSASVAEADPLMGIASIAPGEAVVFVDDSDTAEFESVWGPVIDLTGVQIGTYAGAGLGGGGDAVTLFIEGSEPIGDGALEDAVILDIAAYPDTVANPGESFDVAGAVFSGDLPDQSGVATTAPNSDGESAVGSPGDGAPIVPAVADFRLELLHIADQEASTGAIQDAPNLSAVVNALRAQDIDGDGDGANDNTVFLSSGDAFIPGVFFSASEAAFGAGGIADIQIQNELGIQAIALGNHEFDFGTTVLASLIGGNALSVANNDNGTPDDGSDDFDEIVNNGALGNFGGLTGTALDGLDFVGAAFPYLSTNLDFTTDVRLDALDVPGGQAPLPGVVTSSVVIDVNGEALGVVGATTPTLASISSPDGVGILPAPFDASPTPEQIDALAAEIQTEVDKLLAANPDMNKVVLLAHMQQIEIELALAERLENVDIIVAGGSNARLFDENDRIRDGDAPSASGDPAGVYPQFVLNAGGTTTAVVNTDGSYKYVGRLVLDFDDQGNVIPSSYEPDVSGAFATDDQGVADLGAEGLIDPEIQAIVDEIEQQIIATESNVFGVSNVFLNGNRSGTFTPGDPDGVRTQETNLGNLTADANLVEAQRSDDTVLISLKNGGGIRASIGETVVPAGGTEAVRQPNAELIDSEGNVIKPDGGISQNDIQTALAFNNDLVLMTLTAAEIVGLLEHGIGALPSVSGRFPQIAGLKFSFDQTQPSGAKIVNAGVFDGDDLVAELVRDAVMLEPTAEFRIVTLDFLSAPRFSSDDPSTPEDEGGIFIGAGDGYPFPNTNTDPGVGELGDPAVIARIDKVFLEQEDTATGAATFADDGTEQDALAEYLDETFNPETGGTPFDGAETGPEADERIQNLSFRDDAVFAEVLPNVTINEIDADQTGTDAAEFIELFGEAGASLDGLSIVLYNGSDDATYDAIDLDGFTLDAEGFFVIGSAAVDNVDLGAFTTNGLQNGADAVVLVQGDAIEFPNDTPIASLDLSTVLDAIVYGTNDPDDAELLAALGGTQFDDDTDGSISRLPDGGATVVTQPATPGLTNVRPFEFPTPVLDIDVLGTLGLDGAEIVDFDPVTERAFVTSGGGLQVVDASDITNPSVIATLAAEDLGFDASDITSVSVKNGLVAVARPDPTGTLDGSTDPFTGAGQVLFYDAASLSFLGFVQVGPLPDMLNFDETGRFLLVANEGQSSGVENEPDATQNPAGSVSIIEVNTANPTASSVTTLDFSDSSITTAALRAKGVRVNTDAPSAAADLEPEFITITGTKAFVALQENNAVAVIQDITAPTAFTIDDILPLGTKDHALFANRLDPSNRDGGINLAPYDIQGLFMPDGLDSYEVGGVTYFLTANEGDGRDVDESRGADLVDGDLTNGEIDTTEVSQTLQDQLADDALLGRLLFSNVDGDIDGDGLIEELNSFGARSFSIYDETGTRVFDSGSDFAQITAALVPDVFNGSDDGTSFDNRSDDKGAEPEAVELGEIGGRVFAFVGLERVGGIMVYDVSDPQNVRFDQYIRNEDASGNLIDIAPEGLAFISASDSPTGTALLAVASEGSNTLTFHEITRIDDSVLISEIQGETDVVGFNATNSATFTSGVDDISPFDGQEVTVRAIVTADFQGSSGLNGFFLQEEEQDSDGNPFTSEGIFVFDGGLGVPTDVQVGDLVEVSGIVAEFFGETQISAVFVDVISSGNALPTATTVDFPTVGAMIDEDGDFVAGLEALEGMLVNIPEDMTITELFQLDRFGQLKVSADGRLGQFTQTEEPDAAGFQQHLEDIAARTLTIDDGQRAQNPEPILIPDGNDGTLTATDSFRIGDTLSNISGVLSYSEDFQSGSEEPEFRIHLPSATYAQTNSRPLTPEDVTANVTEPGAIKVASLNVLNYFTTIDDGSATTDTGANPRGADDLTGFGGPAPASTDPNAEFDRQSQKLVNAIVKIDADILGLNELENSATDAAIADLVARVNAVAGAGTYDFIPTGKVGTDAITTGIIFKPGSVTPTGTAILDTAAFTDPLGSGSQQNRPAVAATFAENVNGEEVTVAVNHLKSKGSLTGVPADTDQGDGQGNNNATRAAAAVELANWLSTDPTGSSTDNVLVVGDLNAYAREDPLSALAATGFTDPAQDFIGNDAYSFVFDGQSGTLDYILANDPALSRVTDVTEWHINADEADAIDYNLDFGRNPALFDAGTPARNSDHDPVIVGLDFRSVVTGSGNIFGTAAGEVMIGSAAADFFVSFGGDDRFIGGAGDDNYVVDSAFDVVFELEGEGYDRIRASVDVTMADNVEAADAVVGAGDIAITGNASDNWINGNEGDNTLVGLDGNDRLEGRDGQDILIGGAGSDLLTGGAGADTFVITVGGGLEVITDFEVGIDKIDITATGLAVSDLTIVGTTSAVILYDLNAPTGTLVVNGVAPGALSASDFITAPGPTPPIVGTSSNDVLFGTLRDDMIRGLEGNDLLFGQAGADTMEGGVGDDDFFVDDAGDIVVELQAQGFDRIRTSVDYTLSANVEAGAVNGTGAVNITGNDLANFISGNGASNVLAGAGGNDRLLGFAGTDVLNGGRGNDNMTGGTEADSFAFLIGDGFDTISDFELGIDLIDLSGNGLGFGDLTFGTLGTGATVSYDPVAPADSTIFVQNVAQVDLDNVANFQFV